MHVTQSTWCVWLVVFWPPEKALRPGMGSARAHVTLGLSYFVVKGGLAVIKGGL